MNLKIILLTLGILALIESILILLFPNQTIKAGRKMLKNAKSLRKVGIYEIVIAVILIIIALIL